MNDIEGIGIFKQECEEIVVFQWYDKANQNVASHESSGERSTTEKRNARGSLVQVKTMRTPYSKFLHIRKSNLGLAS